MGRRPQLGVHTTRTVPWRVTLGHMHPRSPGVAAEQDGLVTRQQALAAGLTPHQICWATRPDGPWQPVLRAVYATFTGPLAAQQRERAALLCTGASAQLAGASACRRHGLCYVPADNGEVHVLLPRSDDRRSTGFVAVRHSAEPPAPWSVRGLPTSPVHDAVVAVCRDMTALRDVRALMCEAVQRRRTTVEHLARCLAHGPSAGSALPRHVLGDLRAGCQSAPECEFRDLARGSTVLHDVVFTKTPIVVGGVFLGEPDAHVLRLRLAYEVNSLEHHGYGDDFEATTARQARFAAAGWLVVPVTPRRMRADPGGTVRDAEGAYLNRCADLGLPA